jgi:hypothetical protein
VVLEVRGKELAGPLGLDLREHVLLGDLDVLGRDTGELGDLGALLLEDGLEVGGVDGLARGGLGAVLGPLPELAASSMRLLMGTQPLPEIQAAQYERAAETLSRTPASVTLPGTLGSRMLTSRTWTLSLRT